MPLPFNKSLDLKLIAMVKDNPVLYNPTHPKHMDFDQREVVWQKIGDELNRPGLLCKSRFINIRDMVRKKYKERMTNANPKIQIRSYKYEEEMAFTIPFFRDLPQGEDFAEYLEEANNCEVEMPEEVFVNDNEDYDQLDTKDIKFLNYSKKRHEESTSNRENNDSVIHELDTTDPLDVFLLTIAVEFAGIQCQIHYGDFQEEKHKPGLIENLSEYLPEQYSSSWGIEKKILREFRKHQGLGQVEAKFLYTKTARDLPTYGVTFFLVKEKQKGKKKLVPRLLGINAESILRLDEVTKEILQVWPLTQVKTYHAGMSETFTLNFGDYSDKEYSVKTNDAHRIRDILQGYIDIIRKRMEANYNLNSSEHYAITEDNVQSARGNIIERVEHKPSKIVEESFVGPNQIFTYEPGKSFAQGTQIVTVQQLVMTAKGGNYQTVTTGEQGTRSIRLGPMDFIRKLNRLNSNSVKIVTLLSEPNQVTLSEARQIVDKMEADMPALIEAIKKEADMEPNEEARKKRLDELQELSDCMKALSDNVANGRAEEAQEAGKRIADLSIQLCCSFDPGTIKRGDFCRRSRKSFIKDEKIDATLRRASCLAAAQTAAGTLNAVRLDLAKEYTGPPLDAAEVEELEKSAADKMAKLNAAVALNLTAYTDRRNIDYSAAVTSMNTINELLPELVKDVKALSSVKDGKNREELLNAARALCDAVAAVCAATDPDDHEKMENAAKDYAQKSGKLLFTFRRGRGPNADKEKDILAASQGVVSATKSLTDKSKQLGDMANLNATETAALEEACDQCSTAANDVLICAQLTASSIHEPHCRSALKAASEALSSSAQHLAVPCKPMLQSMDSSDEGKDFKQKFLDLAAALDCLKDSFAGFDEESPEEMKANRKLKFITTVGEAKKKMKEAEDELNKPHTEPSKKETEQELQRRLAQRMAQLNAALAALLAATSDRDKPDYETAELAVATIAELMPKIVKDGKQLSSKLEPATRELMLEDLKALCEVTSDICHNSENGNLDDINKQASKLAKSSGKLIFMFKPHGKNNNEKQIESISASANEKAVNLIAGVQDLCQQVGSGAELENANQIMADAARVLETATQLTAPCIEDPRCQESLILSADAVSSADHHLSSVLASLKNPQHKAMVDKLEAQRKLLEEELDRLRKACRNIGAGGGGTPIDSQKRKEAIRLQFTRGGERLATTRKLLDKPTVPLKSKVAVEDLRSKLADDVNRLNAAVAALVAATADRESPDSEATEEATNTINQLLPQVITDTKTLSSVVDERTRAALLADLRAICDATADIFNSTDNPNQDVNRAAVKFGAASGRLVYVFDPRADQEREHVVLDLSSSSCEKASALLSGVYQLATEIGGEEGTQLDNAGSKVADGANMLLTTAQLTSPCIQDPSCRSKLLSSADVLEAASHNLASIWKPIVQKPNHSALGDTLKDYQKQLEEELEKLRKACEISDSGLQTKSAKKPVNEKQRLQFVSTAMAANNNLKQLEKELDEPLPQSQAPVASSLQNKLAQSLAQLNAAIASLLAATSDRDNQDYEKAEQAMQEINQIMPHVVNDTRVVAAGKDPQTRDLMLSDLRAACSALRSLCADTDSQGRNAQAAALADKCNKLYYVVSPTVDQVKEHEIIDLTTEACQKAAALLSGVNQLASSVQGVASSNLDAAGARTADATDTLLATAQLTAASIHDPASRSSLLSSTDGVYSTLTALTSTWEPVVKDPVHAAKGKQLTGHRKDLEDALERLRAAIMEDRGSIKPPMKKAPPPPPRRIPSNTPPAPSAADITQHFLDALRDDADREAAAAAERQRLEEEKAQQQKLRSAVDSAVQRVQKAGEELSQIYSSNAGVTLTVEQTALMQKQMEHKLAKANAAAAKLVAAQHLNELDYSAASECTAPLAHTIEHIVQDAKCLRGALDEEERKSFLEDVLTMFDAAKVLLGAAKNDPRNINESAVLFGNKTAKLLYVVSTDVDPSQEKEVFVQARAIGDSSSRLAVLAAEKGGARGDAKFMELCARGGACADAAGTMLYTAKLVAPCIQDSECQQSLTKASDELSQLVGQYSTAWEAIDTDPITKQELQKETEKLSNMLDTFKEDIQSGRLVRRRPVERIAVHDTPLRRLACAILEDAEKRANQSSLSPEQQSAYRKYGEQLNRGIRQVDRAYHHSTKAPHDLDKRLQLENAIQELQVAALMQRPAAGQANSNIVDLTDYVRAVSEDAEKLHSGCNEQPEHQMVKEHCERIKECAARVMNPELYEESPGDGDRRDVAQFAEDCDKRVKAINSIIYSLQDGKVQIDLKEKAAQLSESTNLLNFATKCDLATTQSVSLDATLEELTDLEQKIDEMLLAGRKPNVPYKLTPWSQSGRGRLVTAASRAGTGVTSSLTPAYAAYVDDVRVGGDLGDAAYKQRSKEHLTKVLKLLKTLTMTNSRHVATWQPPNQPEMAEITEQIIKELENNEMSAVDGGQKSVLGEVNISKLLLPTDAKIQVDPKQVPEKLNQAASKLSCAVGTLIQSANKPTSLARTVPSVYESAMGLATIARYAPVKDIAHSKKIDEASKEMSIQTYNVLKTAESVSQEPNNYAARRKFLDACNRLNDAISILVRSATPSDKLHKECAVSVYKLQQHGAAPTWGCYLGYPQILPALHNQRDVIEKLNDEAPQSREEFSRSLAHVSSAVGSSAHCAAHAAYLLSIADQHSELATEGFMDVGRIQSLLEALQESCYRVMMTEDDQAKEEAPIIIKQVQDFKEAVTEAQDKIKEEKDKNELIKSNNELEEAVKELNAIVHEKALNRGRLSAVIVRILELTRVIIYIIERVSVIPEIKEVSPEAKARSDDVLKNCRNLNTKMLSLIREVKASEDDDPMTWVCFGTRKAVLEMFEALVNCVQENGKRAGILEPSELEEEQVKRSFVQVQLDLANKWLARPTVKPEIKTSGEQSARTIISLGEKISEDLKGQEKEEIMDLVTSSEELLGDCLKKHDKEKAHLLMERLKSLRKAIERCVVARIVDDFLEGEEPLADLDILCDAETDEEKRKFILERKIAELLANLGRVTKTARVVAKAGCGADTVNQQLLTCSDQTELLAPMLVQSAQKRVVSPDDKAAIEHYQKLLAQYADSLANLRGLCDQAVDPMDFVQTAGETMQRLREDTTNDNDPQKCAYASTAITKLANRVITVSMSSSDVRKDPELQKALKEAKERLKAVVPGPNARPSRIPDWKITTAEILRTTGEVESVLGGEMIFKKQQTTDEPIFAAAYDLHAAMRSWSAKDNEIVAVAKRMAVLMAKLSDYMHTDRKRDVIVTAKAIVNESREVAELARKLANECSDVRIKTNLLQICERIPTISGQLKMLATVKGSLGHQGLKEDQEDMNMLVGNAQNLMLSVQEAVNAAASASVKIMSQRGGPRMRWVRKSYY